MKAVPRKIMVGDVNYTGERWEPAYEVLDSSFFQTIYTKTGVDWISAGLISDIKRQTYLVFFVRSFDVK